MRWRDGSVECTWEGAIWGGGGCWTHACGRADGTGCGQLGSTHRDWKEFSRLFQNVLDGSARGASSTRRALLDPPAGVETRPGVVNCAVSLAGRKETEHYVLECSRMFSMDRQVIEICYLKGVGGTGRCYAPSSARNPPGYGFWDALAFSRMLKCSGMVWNVLVGHYFHSLAMNSTMQMLLTSNIKAFV